MVAVFYSSCPECFLKKIFYDSVCVCCFFSFCCHFKIPETARKKNQKTKQNLYWLLCLSTTSRSLIPIVECVRAHACACVCAWELENILPSCFSELLFVVWFVRETKAAFIPSSSLVITNQYLFIYLLRLICADSIPVLVGRDAQLAHWHVRWWNYTLLTSLCFSS